MLDISVYADILICMKTTAQLFKALGDETRLRIITLLLGGRELCVCDIMAVLELPQSTVSRHLSYLRNTGLVEDRRQGIWMYYRISRAATEHATALFDLLAQMLRSQDQAGDDLQRLEKHLTKKKNGPCS
jgi:ArsR family transcriptional regulator, arsenate/arsenite/antimonite-responsive transcriptional repressor